MLHWALLDPVIHFFTKQSSTVGSLNKIQAFFTSVLRTGTFVGKASAAMVCKEYTCS